MSPASGPATDADHHRQAVQINDDLVQGLVVARMAVHLGELRTAAQAIDRSLDAARKVIGELLADGRPVLPGSLVRQPPDT